MSEQDIAQLVGAVMGAVIAVAVAGIVRLLRPEDADFLACYIVIAGS